MKAVILFAIIGVLGFFLLGYMHEQAHVEIFRMNNVTSHVEYFSHFPDMVTIPDKSCNSDACRISHANVEAIGYQIMPFFILLFFGLLIIIGELSLSNYLKELDLRRKYEAK